MVGYGKLGGWELGYSSDLDLIFLHDCPMDAMTDGEREIDGRQFYLRLAQRIMHLFSTRTSSGILYEVDARLRPSGAAGMLVTSAEAFADYQKKRGLDVGTSGAGACAGSVRRSAAHRAL